MAKYHINPETGNANVCRATVNCPFGDLEKDHYPSKEAAQQVYEQRAAEHLAKHEEYKQKYFDAKDDLTDFRKRFKALQKISKTPEDFDNLAKAEEMLRNKIDAQRQALYDFRTVEEEVVAAGFIEPYEVRKEKAIAKKKKKEEESVEDKKDKPLPDTRISFPDDGVNEKDRKIAIHELAVWGDMTVSEATRKFDAWDESTGMSRDEYVVSLFQENMGGGRHFVYIDLETTSYSPVTGEIIEIGVIEVDETGEVVAEIDERYDMSDPMERDRGTGPEHIHGISPDDIRGKKTFRDPDVQEKLSKILNDKNSVVIAHNAGFEKRWLDQNLKGFYDKHDPNSAKNKRGKQAKPMPIMDTMNLSRILCHSTRESTLQSFVEANGGEYKEAHQAAADARMTHRALENFFNAVKNAPRGKRPEL